MEATSKDRRPVDRSDDRPAAGERLTFGTERLGALCDGVVAITATLLVIDLKVPIEASNGLLPWENLREQAHLFLSWAISFMMVGVIWYEQHFIFSHSAKSDPLFILVTFLQLAMISLIPFGSNMVGSSPTSLFAAFVFTGIMTANGLLIAVHGFLLSRRAHLHRSPDAALINRRAFFQVVAYLATAAFSVFMALVHHPLTGVLAWIVTPLLLAANPHSFLGRGGNRNSHYATNSR